MAGYGYGYTNNRGNYFNTYKAMERHMDGNGYRDSTTTTTRPSSYAHSGYPTAAGESFLSMKDNGGEHPSNNIVEQDLFEKVRMQVTQLSRRRNRWVKPASNGEYDHKPNGLQNGKYNNNFYAAPSGAQRLRFGAPAGNVSTN